MEYNEHDVDELLRENERELGRLAEAAAALREITGRGESRSGLTTATVDAAGRLQDVSFSPRIMRLDAAAVAEEVVQAVRQAQEDQDRQARAHLGVPMDHQVSLEEIHRRFTDFHESFRAETAERNDRMRRLAVNDEWD
ncbi:YbaB/EbfC family nucleoid-associated protein [Nonomuraea sp. SBT364]|uniref:YbaB/EbfC family nucleoid-associated protein n=1 Tax=Nonomuraea sp. SBT364 TaxID=1580530 RepID=UPI00066C818A|nr:YbaB/EbfC family nucleoid-associated protein [Nonomuraea sp. SBT364]